MRNNAKQLDLKQHFPKLYKDEIRQYHIKASK